jgi:antitoxin component YwqK of YwqJK toxin-antitoxin module
VRFFVSIFALTLLFALQSFAQDSASFTHKRVVVKPYEGLKIIYEGLKSQPEIPDGYYKVFYQNQLFLEGSYKKGIRHGSWTRYAPHRKPLIKGSYINGKEHGDWEAYNSKGEKKALWWYYLGQKVDEWQTKSNDNQLLFEASFQQEGSPKNVILHYPDGKIAANYEFEYQDGNTVEIQSLYYENYRIHQYQRLVNGKRNGPFKKYHQNGLIWESFIYENNKLLSAEKMQSRSAQELNVGDFSMGNGQLRRYYQNGLIYSHTHWKEGVQNGSMIIFDNGIEAVSGSYRNGIPTGKWDIDDGYHNPQQSLEFNAEDSLLYSRKLLSSNKTEAVIGAYDFQWRKTGEWKTLNIYKEPMEIVHYEKGLKLGNYMKYDFGGVIRAEGTYNLDEPIGEWQYRNSLGTVVYREQHHKNVRLTRWENLIDSGFVWVLPPEEPAINTLYLEFDVGLAKPDPLPEKKERILEPIYFAIPRLAGTKLLHQPHFLKSFEDLFIPFKQEDQFEFQPSFLPPRFSFGAEAFDQLLDHLLKYTKTSLDLNVHGRLWVLLEIDEFGMVKSCETVKTLGYGLDQSAELGLMQLPPFLPAEYQGLPVKCYVLASVKY